MDDDKALRKHDKSSYNMKVDTTNKTCVVKWVDNKTVCLASTFCEVKPLGGIKRFQSNDKKKKRIHQPVLRMKSIPF